MWVQFFPSRVHECCSSAVLCALSCAKFPERHLHRRWPSQSPMPICIRCLHLTLCCSRRQLRKVFGLGISCRRPAFGLIAADIWSPVRAHIHGRSYSIFCLTAPTLPGSQTEFSAALQVSRPLRHGRYPRSVVLRPNLSLALHTHAVAHNATAFLSQKFDWPQQDCLFRLWVLFASACVFSQIIPQTSCSRPWFTMWILFTSRSSLAGFLPYIMPCIHLAVRMH